MTPKLSCAALKKGMFVSSLDRPWIDTPFLFQGFLIEEDEDIRLLQKYCQFVHIDWDRSTIKPPDVGLNPKEGIAASTGQLKRFESRVVQVQTPEQVISAENPLSSAKPDPAANTPEIISRPTFENHQNVIHSTPVSSAYEQKEYLEQGDHESLISVLTGKFFNIFRSTPKSYNSPDNFLRESALQEDPVQEYVRPAFIPSNIELSAYVDARPVEEEIAPAVKAHTRINDAISNLVQDIKTNQRFSLQETEAVIEDVVNSMVRNPDAMMWVTRLRKQDEVAYGHGLQVAVYMVALGRHLGLPRSFLDNLCTIGLLLDIGKIRLPKELLQKQGRLTPEKFETVKNHVQYSLDILKDTPGLHADVLEAIEQHHERENGSGYPAGLKSQEIGLFGRMAAIVDSFSALTNPRSYADTMPAYEALQTLSIFNSELYQASMVEQFVQAIGVFPVGSLVELSSGEIAVVVSHSKVRRLKPKVLVISDTNKIRTSQPRTLDLIYQQQREDEDEIIILHGLPTGAYGMDAREYYLA